MVKLSEETCCFGQLNSSRSAHLIFLTTAQNHSGFFSSTTVNPAASFIVHVCCLLLPTFYFTTDLGLVKLYIIIMACMVISMTPMIINK